tara:strand:+ start:438 stop:1211 length:774 start_codon:yes stop_codon:yes gene_type:complete
LYPVIKMAMASEMSTSEYVTISGMHRLAPQLARMRKVFDSDAPLNLKEVPSYGNDFIMALLSGVRQAAADLKGVIDNSALVSALLLSFVVPTLLSPPDSILNNSGSAQTAFLVGFTISASACLCCILLSILFSLAVTRSARDSDTWKILVAVDNALYMGAADLGLNLMYASIGGAAVGTLATVFSLFGNTVGVICTVGLLTMVIATLYICMAFLFAGHLFFYWHLHGEKNNDPIKLKIAFDEMERKVNASMEMELAR